jgi:tripartite-type tricarboxylate transporter receptor subunit TctC
MKFHFTGAVLTAAILLSGCGSGNTGGDSSASARYPSRTVTIICPWAAGGGTDRMARFMADQLQREFGKPVVVLNQTGGSGAVGHSAGALARPDGYTITMATFELSTMRTMGISDLTCDNFDPVMQLNADAAAIIVRQDAPWRSVGELLDHIKANPGRLKMSGTSTGGAWDLARAGFLNAAGLPVNAVLWVPTQGSAPSLVQLLGGHIDVVCCSVPEAATQIEAGQLRVLAVMAPERLQDFPSVPTVQEAGIDWDAVGWRGLVVPKGTPSEITDLIAASCSKIVETPEFKDFMRKNGFAIALRGPDQFAQFLRAQEAHWKPVIEAAGYASK